MRSRSGTPCGLSMRPSWGRCRAPQKREHRRGGVLMTYLAFGDLVKRWTAYTPRGVRKLISSADFPAPLFALNVGKTKVWSLPIIQLYERDHPELTSHLAKRNKVRRAGHNALWSARQQKG